MPNLFAALVRSGNALDAFQRALGVVQNNLANATTPGYARQRAVLEAQPFQLSDNLLGGVRVTGNETARDFYAESAVWSHSSPRAAAQEITNVLAEVEGLFGRDPESGLRGAFTRLFDSFSDWSMAVNDTRARQNVLDSARETAQIFQQTAGYLLRTSQDLHERITVTVERINTLASELETAAAARGPGNPPDAGAEAQFFARLEELSTLADITVSRQSDGTYTVLLAGQSPLLIGNRAVRIPPPQISPPGAGTPFPEAPPSTRLLDASGQDVTALITGGELGGLLELRNRILPGLIGSSDNQGRLNRLAQSFADQVNQILLSGQVTDPPSVAPEPLFLYDTANPARAAATLALNPALTPQTLAAIQTAPSFSANGIPAQLAALRDSSDPAQQVNGFSYTHYVLDIVTGIGTRYQRANGVQDLENHMLVQAQNFRQHASGVSLEQEAVLLLQFQRAYQAASRVVNVLDELTQTVLGMVR